MPLRIAGLVLAIGVAGLPGAVGALGTAQPPKAPDDGAGSLSYPYDSVAVGSQEGDFVLYEPDDRDPNKVPAKAPVLVYLHGAQMDDQRMAADAMLRHLARKGFVVLYAEEGTVATRLYEKSARRAIGAGLAELRRPDRDHVRPNGQFGFIGFSLGGIVALRLAADPKGGTEPDIPRPAVVVLHDPAGEAYKNSTGLTLSAKALAGLDPAAKLLIIQAQSSASDPNSAAPNAWANSPTLERNANWLRVPSDLYGLPPLLSVHDGSLAAPGGNPLQPLDAIDWWGYWRPTEAAVRAAFGQPGAGYDPFCKARTKVCAPVRRMGQWSDQHAAATIQNAGDLSQIPKPKP